MSRPEHQKPADLYYDEDEAINTRIMNIQTELTERALELLNCDEKSFLLDIGCGSGLSGRVLTEQGHTWMGVDISRPMLDIANEDKEGELVQSDIGLGLPFKGGIFDGVISISAIQWLCYSYKKVDKPPKRMSSFFTSLYSCMKRNARAVLQFYPENNEQIQSLNVAAMKAGFSSYIVIDYPNSTRRKKIFMVLDVSTNKQKPAALMEDNVMIKHIPKKHNKGNGKKRKGDFKEESYAKSKYSGRKRCKKNF